MTLSYAGYLQFSVATGQIHDNFSALRQLLGNVSFPAGSLVVLPELFLTGFAYTDLAELYQEQYQYEQELCNLATEKALVLAGSLLEQSEGSLFYNCLKFLGDDSAIAGYNYKKTFLFPGEEQGFIGSASVSEPIWFGELGVGPLVCYDQRFPHLARSYVQQGATVLICSAQWPRKRIDHWRALNIARAIENQCYLIGCNAIGMNNKMELGGHSIIVDPLGRVLHEAVTEADAQYTDLDNRAVAAARETYRSFCHNPMGNRLVEKFQRPQYALQKLRERQKVGQKVICVTCTLCESLHKTVLGQADIEKLERLRAGVDFMAIAVPDEAFVYQLAGLGCVDMVFVWQRSSRELFESLKGCCPLSILDWK